MLMLYYSTRFKSITKVSCHVPIQRSNYGYQKSSIATLPNIKREKDLICVIKKYRLCSFIFLADLVTSETWIFCWNFGSRRRIKPGNECHFQYHSRLDIKHVIKSTEYLALSRSLHPFQRRRQFSSTVKTHLLHKLIPKPSRIWINFPQIPF